MKRNIMILSWLLAFLLMSLPVYSYPIGKKSVPAIQKVITGLYDIQTNDTGNVNFYSSNYGINNLNILMNSGGCYWPRNSQNQYIFASGLWLGAEKKVNNVLTKLVEVTYNPNSGNSWMVPGKIEDGDLIDTSNNQKYRLYFSSDFNNDGSPKNNDNIYNWPQWKTDNQQKLGFSEYASDFIGNTEDRKITKYPFGPAVISDQDIVSVYKDSDLSRYEGGSALRKNEGFPLRLEYTQRVFTWNREDLKDLMVYTYEIKNYSKDTLYNCWIGGVFDTDLALKSNAQAGASNDRVRTYNEGDSLIMSVSWTNGDRGEAGKGFGYVGIHLLESPAVDYYGWLYSLEDALNKPQLGLKTNRNWSIDQDLTTSQTRYDYMSSGLLDSDNGPGDKRIMTATGPFNFRPGEKTRITFCIAFASPAKGGEADGTDEDIAGIKGIAASDKGKEAHTMSGEEGTTAKEMGLAQKIKKIRQYYYNGIASSVDNSNSADLTLISIDKLYPNPIKQSFNINFHLKKYGTASLTMYDQTGRKIEQYFDRYFDSGDHTEQIVIDKFGISKGLYFLELKSGSAVSTARIVIE